MHDTQAVGVIGKRHHRFALDIPPRIVLLACTALAGSVLAVFGSLLLQILRNAGR